jgi:hypothetical protein
VRSTDLDKLRAEYATMRASALTYQRECEVMLKLLQSECRLEDKNKDVAKAMYKQQQAFLRAEAAIPLRTAFAEIREMETHAQAQANESSASERREPLRLRLRLRLAWACVRDGAVTRDACTCAGWQCVG